MDDAQAFLKYVHDHAFGQSEETLRRAFAILRDAMRHNEVQAALTFAQGDEVQFRGRRGIRLTGMVTKVSHATSWCESATASSGGSAQDCVPRSSDQRDAGGGAVVADLKRDKPLPFSDQTGSRHVILAGVAAVGKTTLGLATAPLLCLLFADTDLTMEQQYGVTIDELSREPGGDARIGGLLWEIYQALVNVRPPTLIAAPPRLLAPEWERAVSVHLRSTRFASSAKTWRSATMCPCARSS